MSSISLRRNILLNYIGQLYTTLIGILILPLYLRHMGAEAFGLVGFFALLAAWVKLLDLGMTPTLGREVARLKDDPSQKTRLTTVVNSLESVFIVIAVLVGGGLFLARGWIATDWISFDELPVATVTTAIGIMAVMVATKWVSSLNRSGVNAYEAQVWMNMVDIVTSTLRFPVSLALLVWTDGNVLVFFSYQLVIIVGEFIVIRAKLRRLMPDNKKVGRRFEWGELRRIAPFSLGIAYAGAVWVLLTQLDKLLLSKVLTLSEYGYFTLVATISTGVMLLSGPVSKAVLPRMTALLAAGNEKEMLALYRQATRLVVAVIAPITLVIATQPELVVYVWTGVPAAAEWTAPILPLFALGSGLLAITAFQYYLQYAHGVLRYHVAYNTVSVLINVPLITYAAFEFGAIGVAWVWFGFRALSLLVWVPFVHQRFAPGLHAKWMARDVLPPVAVTAFVVWVICSTSLFDVTSGRFSQLALLAGLTAVMIMLALAVAMHEPARRKRIG